MKRCLSLFLSLLLIFSCQPVTGWADDDNANSIEHAGVTETTATPVVTEEPEATPVVTKEPEATPVVTVEPEATPMVTGEPEATPVVTVEPEATPMVTGEPEESPEATTAPEEDQLSFMVSPEILEFGAFDLGTEYPEAKIMVTNTGNTSMTFTVKTTGALNAIDSFSLDAQKSYMLSVFPATSCKTGHYSEMLYVRDESGEQATVLVTFTITNLLAAKNKAALPVPTGFTAISYMLRAAMLSWSPVTGATYYILQRSTSYSGTYAQVGGNITGTQYEDNSNLIFGTTYFYRLKAMNSAGDQSLTTAPMAVTIIPYMKRLLSATPAGATKIKLEWEKSPAATGYYVWRAPAGTLNYTKIATVMNYSNVLYTDSTGLTTGTPYSYKIQSFNTDATTNLTVASDFSNILTAVPAPIAPENLVAKSTGFSSINLSWDVQNDATNYTVYRSDSAEGTFIELGTVTTNSYSDSNGLQTGVKYYYQVTTNVNSIRSAPCAPVSAMPVPVAPSGVTAVSASDSSIKVSWTPSATSGYSGYRVLFDKTPNGSFSNYIEVSGSNASSCIVTTIPGTLTPLSTGIHYYFKVQGYVVIMGGTVSGDASNQATAAPKPNMPQSFAVTCKDYQTATLSWKKVNNALGYEVYRGLNTDTSTYKKVKVIADNGSATYTYDDTGLYHGVTYYYRIIAYTNDVYSAYTSVCSTRIIPAKPTLTNCVTLTNMARLTWTKVPGATGYAMYYSTFEDSGYALYTTINGGSTLSGNVGNLTVGQTYYFKVKALRTMDGYTTYGNLSNSMKLTIKPSQVLNARGTSLDLNTAYLIWNAVTGATAYTIYSCDIETGTYEKVTDVNSNSISFKTIPGKLIYYKVKAYVLVGGTAVYGDESAAFAVRTYPKNPTLQSANAVGESEIKVTWKQSADLAGVDGGYVLYRSINKANAYSVIATFTRADIVEYIDSTALLGTTYDYLLKSYAVTSYGKMTSGGSAIVSGNSAPSAPSDLTVTGSTYNSLRLTWTKKSDVTGYNVFYATSENGTYTLLKTVAGNSANPETTITSGLAFGQGYYFKVRGYLNTSSATLYGNFSNFAKGSLTTDAPTSVHPEVTGAAQVTVYWSNVSGAAGYFLYQSTSASGPFTLVGTTDSYSAKSYTLRNLQIGTTYYFKVCAYSYNNGQRVGGTQSKAVSIQIAPMQPQNLKATVKGYRSIELIWSGVPGAHGYRILRSPANVVSYSVVADYITSASYLLTNEATGVEYKYSVEAYVYSGSNRIYGQGTVIKATAKLGAPTTVNVTYVNSGTMQIKWSAVANATGYRVQFNTGSGYNNLTVYDTNDVFFENFEMRTRGIMPGTKIDFRVIAHYMENTSSPRMDGNPSAVVSITAPVPEPVSFVASKTSDAQARLTWTGYPSAVSGYLIYRATLENGPYQLLGAVGNTATGYNTTIAKGNTYYYQIRAYYVLNSQTTLYSSYKYANLIVK